MESQDLFGDVEEGPLRSINSLEPSGAVPSKKPKRVSMTTRETTSRDTEENEENDGLESDDSEDDSLSVHLKQQKIRSKTYKLEEAVQKAIMQSSYGKVDHASIKKLVGHYRKSDITKEENAKFIGGHELATDAIVGDELSKLLTISAEMINKAALNFDASEFAENLNREGISLFYEKNCKDVFFTAPQFSSLCFLDTDAMPKIKKPRTVKGRVNSKKGELVDVKGKHGDQNNEEKDVSLMHHLKFVKKCFRNALKQRGTDFINYYSFVINPHDFGATIQNCFYVSFVLKDSSIYLQQEDDDEYPILRKLTPEESELQKQAEETGKPLPTHQCINTLTYQKWRHLISRLNITEALIPVE